MIFVDRKRIHVHTLFVIQDRDTLTHGLITQWTRERRATVAEEGPLPCIKAVTLVLAGIGCADTLNLNTKKQKTYFIFSPPKKKPTSSPCILSKKKIAKYKLRYVTGILLKKSPSKEVLLYPTNKLIRSLRHNTNRAQKTRVNSQLI